MELFRLLGTIAIQNEKAIDAINDTVQRASTASKKISDSFTAIGKKSTEMGQKLAKTSLVAGAAFSGIVAGITKTYADYEQLVGGVETLFGDSSDKLIKYANQAYKTAGLSANAYMETATSFSASLLQSLSGDTAKAVEYADLAIRDMSDNANKMGTDMELIQNAYQGFAKQNFMMLDNLKLGYGGTKEEMQRLLEDAEKFKAKNGEVVEYSIDSYADMVEAIHVVQEEMGITGTTAKEAEKTISGSWNALRGAWTNFLTEFGKADADMDKVYEQLEESAKNFAKNISKLAGTVFKNSPFLAIGTALLGLLAIMSPVLIAFGSLMTGIGAIIPLLPKVVAGFATLGKAMFATPIGLILTGITALVTAFIYLWNNCEGFREFWINLWENIKEKAVDAKNIIVTTFKAIGWAMTNPLEAARLAVKAIIDKIKSYFNITLKFKGIKLPKIDVKWDASGLKGKAAKLLGLDGFPSLFVKWNAAGAIFKKPTIFNTPYGLQGVGEAGSEAVAPIDTLQQYVASAVASQNIELVSILQKILSAIRQMDAGMYQNIERALDNRKIQWNDRELGRLVNKYA